MRGVLLLVLLLLAPAFGQEKTVADKAFDFKALPVRLTVERAGATLPITRVPRLRQGDVIHLAVDLERPEFRSENGKERSRLRDWSIAWFLTTEDGSLLYDNDRSGDTPRDRGRIDLAREETQDTIVVAHERQTFPVFFFVRTRTLESWDHIRQTREKKAANFVDHFGSYSDVVNHYENLQVFLTALHREDPAAETVEERLVQGFEVLGFSVDTKMQLSDPASVGTLLSELDRNFLRDGKTFTAEVAGKALSQLIADSELGLIGAAVQIGNFLYSVTDYRESYHWSSARLKPLTDDGEYAVMSAERIRYGEREEGPDGKARDNVRSILVVTPIATQPPERPSLGWKLDDEGLLIPGAAGEAPEVRVSGPRLATGTQPALVDRFIAGKCRVWDSVHQQESPLKASVDEQGRVVLTGCEHLWDEGALRAQVKVEGAWGFEPLPLLQFTALRSPRELELSLVRASQILTQGRRVRLELEASQPVALGTAVFRGKEVPLEPALDPAMKGRRFSVVLDLSQAATGPAGFDVYAGRGQARANRLLHRDFQVVPSARFQVVLPEGSRRCQLVVSNEEVSRALQGVTAIRMAGHVFKRDGEFFVSDTVPSREEFEQAGFVAVLTFDDPAKEPVPDVFVHYEPIPRDVEFVLFPGEEELAGNYRVVLDSANSRILASGETTEFRLVGPVDWPADPRVELCVQTPRFSTRCDVYRLEPGREHRRLRAKRNILFGDFEPELAGKLRCRVRLPVEDSELELDWSIATDWRVVDVPRIVRVTRRGDRCAFEGEDLDVLISRVFVSGDPAVDPNGSRLRRLQDGSCEALSEALDVDDFWIELRDLEGEGKRFRVLATGRG